ncbi:hypothetical protein DB44_FS00020 [Candidatus Protochlamydia amoebophila]|uniref:PI3K/PI4K catalytic domain-containing protein n=1 Tax=Candidatus Protochlamydia amoebophila TaxID=362787 RepID=A0A0C1H795_9BACT|nr:hypothetical protein DB44_FS00020 [Candidatus Protochlamydia amoebophila]
MFVPECVKYGELQKDKHKLIDPKDLQKTVIFDLIAGNTDRHDGNLLCQKVGETYRLFVIDHDQCFQEPSIKGKSLSFCYENLDVLRQQEFLPDIASLISEEAEEIYEQKMKSASIDEAQIIEEDQYVDMGYGSGYGFGEQEMNTSHKIEWMKLVLAKTRKAVKEGETPAELIKNVAKAWENKLNRVVDDDDYEDDY